MSEFNKGGYFMRFQFFLMVLKEKLSTEVPGCSITDALIICGYRGKSSRSSVVLIHKTIF